MSNNKLYKLDIDVKRIEARRDKRGRTYLTGYAMTKLRDTMRSVAIMISGKAANELKLSIGKQRVVASIQTLYDGDKISGRSVHIVAMG